MKKNLLQALIAAAIIALGLLFFFYRPIAKPATSVSTFTDKIHSELYAEALSLWDAGLTFSAFRPQSFNDQTIGSASGVHLTWSQPEKPYNHFLLTITQPESGWSRSESREHDGLSLDLTDLLPNTKYVIDLQACMDPSCTTWHMASDEPSVRTEKLFFQITTEDIDPNGPNIVTHEKLSEQISFDAITFLKSDGTELSQEEKNRLTLGAVFVDTKLNQFFVLIHLGDETRYVRMVNP